MTAVALFGLLAFLAGVVTDVHDRSFPQALGVESRIVLDLGSSALDRDAALAELRRLDAEDGLGLHKLLPDLDDTGAQVLVALQGDEPRAPVDWFGAHRPARVLGGERLANSPVDGTYLVRDADRLGAAIDALESQGIGVQRTDASPVDSLLGLAREPGFAAPVVAACALIAATTVFWLAVRARSRALRVLAGARPWRIQVQDLGGLALLLVAGAAGVAAISAIVVGLARGGVYVPAFLTTVGVLDAITLGTALAVALTMSAASWPSPDLLARRRPAVRSLRGTARVVQAATLVTVIAFTGPAWAAAQNAQQTAQQLEAWTRLSDQVQLAFGTEEQYLDVVAPQIAQVVRDAESQDAAALSFTISEESWQGDFGPYSAIALVNTPWISLIQPSVGTDALRAVASTEVADLLERELGPSLEIWNGGARPAAEVLAGIVAYVPAPGVAYPTAEGGSLGQLRFSDDTLVLAVPEIAAVFDDRNIVSLASTGNIVFAGAAATQDRLLAAGLGPDGLADAGVPGTLRTVYVAEQGILEAQFATYLASILAVSLAALAIAFLVAAAVNAMISGMLHAHRDFPLRLAGRPWERIVRPRALGEVGVGAVLGLLIVAFQPPTAIAVVTAVAGAAIVTAYAFHAVAASFVFGRVTHRRL